MYYLSGESRGEHVFRLGGGTSDPPLSEEVGCFHEGWADTHIHSFTFCLF